MAGLGIRGTVGKIKPLACLFITRLQTSQTKKFLAQNHLKAKESSEKHLDKKNLN
jgi:hypothetical protein